MKYHKAIAIIPARGESKRIQGKNLVDLGGIPLIAYSIINAKKSEYIKGDIYVSTENMEIEKVSKKFGAKVVKRPRKLATDKSSTLSALKHAVGELSGHNLDFDTIVLLQPTTPFRKSSTIDSGIKKLWDNWENLDAVFTVRRTKFPPKWMLKTVGSVLRFLYPNDFSEIRGQDLQKTYEIDGVLYVLKKELVLHSKSYPFAKNKTGFLVTGKIESIDIDDTEDLEIARALQHLLKS